MKLQSILMPLSEFDHEDKGDALYGEFLWSVFKLMPPVLLIAGSNMQR